METPRVTIGDPRSAATSGAEVLASDVLGGGSDRPSRLSHRARVALGAAAVLAAAAAWGGVAVAERRADERERAAAFALADRVHLEGRLVAVFGLERGSARLGADVSIGAPGGDAGRDAVASVRLVGPGIFPIDTPLPSRPELPQQVLPEARVDCGRVAAGQIPQSATVVVVVVPASQVPHEQRLPADPAQVREAALSACDLPDPAAVPVVEASAQGDALLLLVQAVDRSDAVLQLEEVRIAGFDLGDDGGLPRRIEPDTGVFYEFGVRVADCSLARSSDLEVTVLLSVDGRRQERVATDAVLQPQPGSVPVRQLLQRLLDARC